MANVDIKLGYKDSAWFTANPTLILKQGQIVALEQTGTYKLGDGVTQLSALSFLGGGGNVDVNTIGSAINGATSATPNDTDLVMSVDASVAKKNTWTQIKAFLKTYFDTLFVKKGTLTTNYIPKATANDTIGNSQITDDGTTVTVGSSALDAPSYYGDGSNAEVYVGSGVSTKKIKASVGNAASITGTKAIINADDKIELRHDLIDLNAAAINAPQLTASQIVGTDASKNLVSITFGTTAGTVLEGDRITQTITNGVTDKVPSEDAVFDALITKADFTTPMIVFSPIKLNTTISHTGTTNETKLYSVLIPAGTMNANDILEYYALAIPGTGIGNRTLKVYLNTSNAIGGIQIATYTFTTTSNIFKRKLKFKNSLSTQEIIPAGATSSGNFELSTYTSSNVSSIAANFNNDVWFVISMTLSTASDNVSIYSIGSNILR